MKRAQTSLAKVLNLRKAGRSILILAVLLLLAGAALAQGMLSVERWVVGGGGGRAEGGNYTLDGAIGQAVAGVVGNAPYGLCAGFWCGPGAAIPPENPRIYLPLVMRNS